MKGSSLADPAEIPNIIAPLKVRLEKWPGHAMLVMDAEHSVRFMTSGRVFAAAC